MKMLPWSQTFEQAASDVLQGDEDLAAAYNAYTDARRRLNEKFRHRGFWPVSQAQKGKGKGFKGPKGKFGKARKTLQQRIMESRCRICGKMGHWKAECPQRPMSEAGGARSSTGTAPTTFVQAEIATAAIEHDGLPLEFLDLAEEADTVDASRLCVRECFVGVDDSRVRLRSIRQSWGKESKFPTHPQPRSESTGQLAPSSCCDPQSPIESSCRVAESTTQHREAVAFFATHGSYGVVDVGATKTVIGSNLVPELNILKYARSSAVASVRSPFVLAIMEFSKVNTPWWFPFINIS